MFFWLKDERDVLGGEVQFEEYAVCVENLGEAGYRKEHLVFGDRSIIARAMSLDTPRCSQSTRHSVVCIVKFVECLYRLDAARLPLKTEFGQFLSPHSQMYHRSHLA